MRRPKIPPNSPPSTVYPAATQPPGLQLRRSPRPLRTKVRGAITRHGGVFEDGKLTITEAGFWLAVNELLS